MFDNIIEFIRKLYGKAAVIPLHEPKFIGNEKKYLNESIDSTFVSSVGKFVDQSEEMLASYTGTRYAIATVNGTAALHIALILAGVESNNEVITQPLTFVATCNAISYCSAKPVFVDVAMNTLGMSPESLESFLATNTRFEDGKCINKRTNRIIKACVPMHTFGHPCRIYEIKEICDRFNIILVEDAAESLGSQYLRQHTGSFGQMGILSFNGNKVVTSGGGGAILTNDEDLAKKAKHITTTAKIPHRWEYAHDLVGYNYRMPNINAALLCAQLERLDDFIDNKRELAEIYRDFFISAEDIDFVIEPDKARSNYWLNAVKLKNLDDRNSFLRATNDNGILTRPIWRLMSDSELYNNCQHTDLSNANYLWQRIVNIPSSVRI